MDPAKILWLHRYFVTEFTFLLLVPEEQTAGQMSTEIIVYGRGGGL